MLGSTDLVAFVPCSNLETAHLFYGEVLGLERVDASPFANVYLVAGTQLRVTAVPEVVEAGYTVLGWSVPDAEAAVRELEAVGVELLRYDHLEQDDLGIWTSPSGGRIAWFADPDGNTLSVQQVTLG